MNKIKNKFIETFKQIASIPHPSGNTGKLRKFLSEFASSLGFTIFDDGRNLIIKLPATNNCIDQKPVILQGHLDMVAVSDNEHDFLKDGLTVKLTDDQKYLYAEHTSLGGDDGLAICYMLMLMQEEDFSHPPLYLIFTDSEETGCQGTSLLDMNQIIDAGYMINLDTEREGVLPSSSATCEIIEAFCNLETTESLGTTWDINLHFQDTGEHPVTALESGLYSPLNLTAQILCHLLFTTDTRLVSLNMHSSPGLMPNQCSARVLTNTDDETFINELNAIEGLISLNFSGLKKRPVFLIPISFGLQKCKALNPQDSIQVCYHACFLPHGILLRDENTPISSVGIMDSEVNENFFKTTFQIRGRDQSLVEMVKNRLMIYYSYTETHFNTEINVPGWRVKEDSVLRERARKLWKERTGEEPIEPYMHGYIEAGIFGLLLPDLDIISLGSTVENIHSINERLDLDSAVRVYDYLKAILEDFCPKSKETEPTTIERVNGSTQSIQSFYEDRNVSEEETIPDCQSCTIDCPFKN